jgi:hypothetical protein
MYEIFVLSRQEFLRGRGIVTIQCYYIMNLVLMGACTERCRR